MGRREIECVGLEILLCVSVCLCIVYICDYVTYVLIYANRGVYTCVCMYVETKIQCQISLYDSCLFEASSVTKPRVHQLSRISTQQIRRSTWLQLLNYRIMDVQNNAYLLDRD